MLNETLLRSVVIDDQSYNRLYNLVSRTVRGQDVDYVSPLVSRNSPLAGRVERIEELAHRLFPTGYQWLDDAENLQREKIGPYSIMLPYEDRRDSVLEYFKTKDVSIDEDLLGTAIELVAEILPPHSLQAVSVDTAFKAMPRNTNLGLPWMTSDSKYYPMVKDSAKMIIDSGFQNDPNYPNLLFWRGQPRGLTEVSKNRVVFGVSHVYIILEEMLQIPLLDALTAFPSFCAWVGGDETNRVITSLIDNAHQEILSVDFSGYDASICELLIRAAFSVIRSWFSQDDRELVEFVEHKFLTTGLLTPDGILKRVDGGVPSGSGLTNMIDSLVQKIAFHYVALKTNNRVVQHLVQGDDGVILFAKPWDLEEISEEMLNLGLKVSSDKGGVSIDRVYYLQNIHSSDYRTNGITVGVRPLMRILNGMMSYERLHKPSEWNGYMDTLRWWQQLESGKHHPKFYRLVDLLYRWDRISHSMGPREVTARAGGLEAAKSLLNEKSFPYGKESLSKLGQFKTVQRLQMLRQGRVL